MTATQLALAVDRPAAVDLEWRHPATAKRPAGTWQWSAQRMPTALALARFGAADVDAMLGGTIVSRHDADWPADWRIT